MDSPQKGALIKSCKFYGAEHCLRYYYDFVFILYTFLPQIDVNEIHVVVFFFYKLMRNSKVNSIVYLINVWSLPNRLLLVVTVAQIIEVKSFRYKKKSTNNMIGIKGKKICKQRK